VGNEDVEMKMEQIKGGYYIKARKIQESDIAHVPPHIREIWDWMLKECNHKDTKVCKRGQCMRSYKGIQEGLSWFVGWRKHTYSKDQCETAMKWLKKHTMITTRKTTRGMVITVINYDRYQNPASYENHKSTHRITTREPQTSHTINKNEENEENVKRIYINLKSDWYKQAKEDFSEINVDYELKQFLIWEKDNPRKSHKKAFKNWLLNARKWCGNKKQEEDLYEGVI